METSKEKSGFKEQDTWGHISAEEEVSKKRETFLGFSGPRVDFSGLYWVSLMHVSTFTQIPC